MTRVQESNPGHTGGRRALSTLRHPCSPNYFLFFVTLKNTKNTPLTNKRHVYAYGKPVGMRGEALEME